MVEAASEQPRLQRCDADVDGRSDRVFWRDRASLHLRETQPCSTCKTAPGSGQRLQVHSTKHKCIVPLWPHIATPKRVATADATLYSGQYMKKSVCSCAYVSVTFCDFNEKRLHVLSRNNERSLKWRMCITVLYVDQIAAKSIAGSVCCTPIQAVR